MTRSKDICALAALMMLIAFDANAHHAMDYAAPANLFEGFVSGLAHPVIGLDHLLFVIAIGAACYFFGRRAASPAFFIAGTLGGTALHLVQPSIPFHDAGVAVSLVLVGVLFIAGQRVLKTGAALLLFGLAGLVHGYAYGEGILGAEATPLFAYLTGFTLVQLAVVYGAFAATRLIDRAKPRVPALRAAGGVLSVAGLAFLLAALTS